MTKRALWYETAIFYELYVRAFKDSNGDGNGDLQGVIQKLDYLKNLGVDCIWLLPIFPSPLKDDGYDVSDYRGIHPEMGTLEDFKELIEQAHKRDLRIITDLVINHSSDAHPWFQAARRDAGSQYHDYYVWSETDDKFQGARIIFSDTETSNWTWDEEAQKYYWHRFYSSQPDFNYANPAVQQEMLAIMKFWLDLGIDGFRVDAIPYLFEREGTSSENLEETHDFLREARRFVEANYKERVLLSEANQWPKDVLPYLGDGDEMNMAFHFPLMPRIFMALRKESGKAIREILEQTPAIPKGTQWCLFLRNHDELSLEMVGEEDREWMWQEYAPEKRMRLNLGIRRRLAPLLNNDLDRVMLAYSILFTLPGTPILYYGDEIGMGDNIKLRDRDGLRTAMQWISHPNAGFSTADKADFYSPLIKSASYGPQAVNVADQGMDAQSLLQRLKRLIAVRKENDVFSSPAIRWLDGGKDEKVLAYLREDEEVAILVLNNMSAEKQTVSVDLSELGNWNEIVDLLKGDSVQSLDEGKLDLELNGNEFRWLKLS
jgi:maltose alpha-D-glucosyltransferase/alpha-amylase